MLKIKKQLKGHKAAASGVGISYGKLVPFVIDPDKTRIPIIFTDAKEPNNPIIFANDSFLNFTAYDREEVLGKSCNVLIAAGTDPEAMAQLAAAFEVNSDADPEIRCRRKDGSEFWATVLVNPVLDDRGDVVQNFVLFADVSKHKLLQSNAKMPIDEINHRVNNILSIVHLIVLQAFRKYSDVEVIQDAIEARIFGLARPQERLTRDHRESAGLTDVVNVALEAFGGVDVRADRFVINGCNIRVPSKTALGLGMTLRKLASNAMKFGALSNDAGSILIAWAIEPTLKGDRLILNWQERGGPTVLLPSRRGFGTRVNERDLPHELEGSVEMDYKPTGVACTISIPAPRGADAA